MGTIAETLLQQDEARGLAKGKAEGAAHSLTRLPERRFGPLPDAITGRIAAADIAALESRTDRVPDAPSLDAIFDARNWSGGPG